MPVNFNKSIFLGTWVFSKEEVVDLKKALSDLEINKLDTALVYSGIEAVLGRYGFVKDLFISSKIPSLIKPPLNTRDHLSKYYPNKEYLMANLEKILGELKRDHLDVLLLHNWSYYWHKDLNLLAGFVDQAKKLKKIRYFGISLPDGFNHGVLELLKYEWIDYLMIPLNVVNEDWSLKVLNQIESHEKKLKVMVRSLFLSGLLFLDDFWTNKSYFRWERYGKIGKVLNLIKDRLNLSEEVGGFELRKLHLKRYSEWLKKDWIFPVLGARDVTQLRKTIQFVNEVVNE